jgi:hypothetical protein
VAGPDKSNSAFSLVLRPANYLRIYSKKALRIRLHKAFGAARPRLGGHRRFFGCALFHRTIL